jgi:hypothetical protein
MRDGKQAFRASLSQAEEPHLVCRMAMVRYRHDQWVEENLACFRE